MGTKYAWWGDPYKWSKSNPGTEDNLTQAPLTDAEFSKLQDPYGKVNESYPMRFSTEPYNWASLNSKSIIVPKMRTASTGATVDMPMFQFDSDEYPVSIKVSNGKDRGKAARFENFNSTKTSKADVYLCDYDNPTKTKIKVGSMSLAVPKNTGWYDTWTSNHTISETDGKKLAGKRLAMWIDQTAGDELGLVFINRAKFMITTGYTDYTIYLNDTQGGKVRYADDLKHTYFKGNRGETYLIQVTPDTGFYLKSIKTTAGTLTKTTSSYSTSESVSADTVFYTYKLSSPGQNATITPTFEKRAYVVRPNVSPTGGGTCDIVNVVAYEDGLPSNYNITTSMSSTATTSTGAIAPANYRDSVYIDAVPASSEYRFSSWEVKNGATKEDISTSPRTDDEGTKLLAKLDQQIADANEELSSVTQYSDGWYTVKDNINRLTALRNSRYRVFTMPANNVNLKAIYLKHAITWKDCELKFYQPANESYVTISIIEKKDYGSSSVTRYYANPATDNFSTTGYTKKIDYILYKNGNKIGNFVYNGNGTDQDIETEGVSAGWQITCPLTEDEVNQAAEVQFKVVAKNSISVDGPGAILNAQNVHRSVMYCPDGENMVKCQMYYCNGTRFIEVDPYYYDGTKWVMCTHG